MIQQSPMPLVPLFISGAALANDPTTPNTVLDYAQGAILDSLGKTLIQLAAGTVNFGTTGAGGLDTGSIGALSCYGIFAISNASGTTSSAIASLATSWAILGDGASTGATTTAGGSSVTLSSSQTVVAGGIVTIVGAGAGANIYRGIASATATGTTISVSPATPSAATDVTVTYEGWANGGGPSLPAGYTLYRYIGSVRTGVGSTLLRFAQSGQRITFNGKSTNALAGSTTAALVTLPVPQAAPLPVLPFGQIKITPGVAGDTFTISDIQNTNTAVIVSGPVLTIISYQNYSNILRAYAGQIVYSNSSTSPADTLGLITNGYVDPNLAVY